MKTANIKKKKKKSQYFDAQRGKSMESLYDIFHKVFSSIMAEDGDVS